MWRKEARVGVSRMIGARTFLSASIDPGTPRRTRMSALRQRGDAPMNCPIPRRGLTTSAPDRKLWRGGSDVVVRRQLTIPREEYLHWSTRTQPAVFIGYCDEDGHTYRRWAQLSRRPMIPEPPEARPAS